MHRRTRMRILTIGGSMVLAASLSAGGAAPAAAQRVPTSTGVAACAMAGVLPACVGGVAGGVVVVPGVVPGIVGGDVRGGPNHENGGRDVDVAAHHGRMLAR